MKLKICLLLLMCFSCGGVFAQTPKSIEKDLLKSFDKIQNWNNSNFITPNDTDQNSLDKANNLLERKLIYYGKKYPSIINQVFKKLGGLSVSSDDGLFNIFSWDTYTGGTQHVFQTVVLYRSEKKASFLVDATSLSDNYTDAYDTLYTLTIGNKNYYLVTYYQILDLHARGEGIRIFSIDNGKLNSQAKIIKTKSGLTSKLYYQYDQTLTNADIMSEVTIAYDPKEKTITFPVINENGRQTDNVITYKFTGKYFERVKN